MDLLRELFDWIGGDLALTDGVDWHCGHLPGEASARPCAVLLETGGPPEQPRLRGSTGEYTFQVLTLGGTQGSYFAARILANRIHSLIGDRPGKVLGDNEALVIDAVAAPQYLGEDQRFGAEISANYIVRAVHTASWWAI